MATAKIKLMSTNKNDAINIAKQIVEIAKSVNVKYSGPIPLPTKVLKVTVRKTPCGDGSHTFEHWEMRIHKWLVEIEGTDQSLHQVMRISVPDTVQIVMSLS
ncbi:MAG: 30S ribosomal protein S10 [Candidatus Micrarchaeaceae archaeon]